jgi:peptidoglycan LD-endopeptidase LytH
VSDARSSLERARARVRATTEQLDALAGSFERARGHAERLSDELDGADDRLARAQQDVDAARAATAGQVRSAYMQPGLDLRRVSGAFLFAPDVGTALHASAMMQRVASNRASQTAALLRAGRQVSTDVQNQRGIASGTSAAMRDLDALSDTFIAQLDLAAEEVAAAEQVLADAEVAEAAAREAAAAAGQAAATQAAVGILGVGSSPAIRIATLNGGTQEMACPLGQPNGFIDSWGFPRSGGRRHQGVDMFAVHGMPVFATADGVIRRVFNNRLGGLSIDLIDGLGNRYYYAHLSLTYVVAGQPVRAGELIAANGNSGNAISTPPHLHWQFHPGDGGPVNPFPLAAALCR